MFIEKLSRLAVVASGLVLTLLAAAPAAHALPKLYLHPVSLMGYEGSAVKIGVDLPCGGVFYGLVAEAHGSTLSVAAAVAQDAVVCTSFRQRTEVAIDHLAVGAGNSPATFKAVTPMTVVEGSRLYVARINDLRIVKPATRDAAPQLTAVYEPRCGRTVGTLIHPAGSSRVELAVVERSASMPTDECRAKQKKRVIDALNAKAPVKFAALRDKPASMGRLFRLRLAKIQPGSLKGSTRSGVSLKYTRACNEAPIGLVLSAPRTADGKTNVSVGMLVARYDNFPCAGEDRSPVVASFTDRGLSLPAGARMRALKPQDDDRIELKEATSIAWATPKVAGAKPPFTLSLKHFKACDETSYAAYARDGRGALAVGVLMIKNADAAGGTGVIRGGEPCNSVATEVSLLQPYVAGRAQVGTVASLKLKGTPAPR
jgi:hypothetical protein